MHIIKEEDLKNYSNARIVKETTAFQYYFHKIKKSLVKIIFVGLILACCFGILSLMVDSKKEETTTTFKEMWDAKTLETYNEIYANRYKDDSKLIKDSELKEMELRVNKKIEDLISSYWAEAKENTASEMKVVTSTYPEISASVVDMPEMEELSFTAQNEYNEMDSYLKANFPDSPMIGLDVIQICKESNITAWQCRLGLAIIKHESRYGTAYAGGRPELGNLVYHNYAGVKCDSTLAKIKPCTFPDENGMYITKFNSPESFLRYFFEQIIGKNWGACKTTACMSPKYVAPSGERNINWENKINGEILNLHFIEY